MTLTVREADVVREKGALLELLLCELEDWSDPAKYDWLYLENPIGRARSWVLEDPEGRVVGVSSAFPRKLRLRGRDVQGWVLGDFCVSQSHRSLGPAVSLLREAFRAVDGGEVDLWYDFPSRSMLAVYERMGIRHRGEIVRLVCPLKVDRMVEKRLGEGRLASGLSRVGNAVLLVQKALADKDRSITVVNEPVAFESSLETEPGDGVHGDEGVWVRRSGSYLNWRYAGDPRGGASMLTASRGGATGGHLVFHRGEDAVTIVDLFAVANEGFFRELVLEVLEVARGLSDTTVQVFLSAEHPWIERFEKLGFRRRGEGPFVAYAREGVLEESTPWFLMNGDRDS